jgi:spore maturation protein CgeB
MKVLVVGDWLAGIYEESFYNSFKEHGCEVSRFSWIQYFKYYQYANRFDVKESFFLSLYYRLQNKFTFGPVLALINKDLIRTCTINEYDLIFIYRGTHIFPETIAKLKNNGAKVFGYNNDDPFGVQYPKYFWRHFIGGVKYYDHIFSYREKNIRDYNDMGYTKTSILRSYYLKDKNFHIHSSGIEEKYKSDVVFVGHYERDGRDEILLHLLKSGISLKLYGTSWDKSPLFSELVKYTGVINPAYDNYNAVLNGARIALVFLSKLNNDTYTRRVFEIPAARTVMVSEYTQDMSSLFSDMEEIFYFSDKDECLGIINMLLSDSSIIESVVTKAYDRLMTDGHEVYDRTSLIIKEYAKNYVK